MICLICKQEMEIEDVLISRTTDPEFDDLFEKMWVCGCGEILEIIDEPEEEQE